MSIKTNINGNRIDFDYPYADSTDKHEERLYWSATQKAEDSLSKIWEIQEERIGEHGDINCDLLDDDFRQLRQAMEQLNEAITYLHLIGKAAEWSEQMAESRESLVEESREYFRKEMAEEGVSEEIADE